MADQWNYQLRLVLADAAAEVARRDPTDPTLAPLTTILARHHATLKCQLDAFADYVATAEREGTANYPLHAWTKATIEQPAKREKYGKAFTLYIDGDETYPKAKADALETDLQPLVGGNLVTGMAKHDTNPSNNPQTPARYRK